MEIILTINWLPGCARPAPWRKFSADSTTQIRGCSDPFSFLFFLWNRALATVSCTFFRPHLPKVLQKWQFLNMFKSNRALATVPCAFCQQLSQINACTRGNGDPTSATPGATLPGKTQGFAPESVFTCEFTCVRTVALPNYLMMRGWHDDVVDIMMCLTWWCEC